MGRSTGWRENLWKVTNQSINQTQTTANNQPNTDKRVKHTQKTYPASSFCRKRDACTGIRSHSTSPYKRLHFRKCWGRIESFSDIRKRGSTLPPPQSPFRPADRRLRRSGNPANIRQMANPRRTKRRKPPSTRQWRLRWRRRLWHRERLRAKSWRRRGEC